MASLYNIQNTKQNSHTDTIGKVILVGAGPGDPDLITVKATKALQAADIVLVDRLVSEVILHRYVSANATVIHVGKECSSSASTPQQQINHLIVKYASEGKNVVRLKGGDVSIFSNVLDELQVLVANKIDYEIIPGITASLGAAAYSGIPLTARGYATSVRFLTSYQSEVVSDDYWQELSKTKDTLVFYMSSGTLPDVVAKLLKFGIAPDVHIAVAEQATTCYQHIYQCNIYDYEKEFGGKKFLSPSLIIIGKVVALHEQFKWLENSNHHQNYFTKVEENSQNINEINKPKKYVV